MKKILCLWGALIVLLFACKDDDNPNPTDPNPPDTTTTETPVRDQLIGTWSITGLEIDGESRTPNGQDQATFNEDDTYSITLPELSFFPTDGKWQLTDNDTNISINDGEYSLAITELGDDDMTLTLQYENFKANTIIYVMTLEKET